MTPKERAQLVLTARPFAWCEGDREHLAKVIEAAITGAVAAEREACAKIAEAQMGGYLCPYGRDKPGDQTWNHTEKDKCPICGFDAEGAMGGCHDTAQGRIAAAIRARGDT